VKLDAHQHFWRFDAAQYPWMKPDWPIRRDFLPPDLEPLLAQAGLDGSIAVQARQTIEESRWLLQSADQHALIKGVVGWVDLRSDCVEDQLAELSRHPRFVGVRHVVQDEPDERFLLRPDFLRGLGLLTQFNLTYDLLVFPKQLAAAIEIARQLPEQPFVLDHAAKPFIRDGTLSPWREQIRELARAANVACKISGLVTEARWSGWQREDFRPYLDVVFEAFGVDRLMFGSDWPVCLLAARYEEVFEIVEEYTRQFSEEDRARIFGGNASRFYCERRSSR
jgi:L-fuconolactonase